MSETFYYMLFPSALAEELLDQYFELFKQFPMRKGRKFFVSSTRPFLQVYIRGKAIVIESTHLDLGYPELTLAQLKKHLIQNVILED